MTIKHRKTSAAGASADPAKVGGDDWNDDHLIDAGGLTLASTATAPAAPGTGKLQLYAHQPSAGPAMPAFVGSRAMPLQPWLGRTPATVWLASWGSPVPTTWGNTNASSSGSNGSASPAFTGGNLYGTLPRCTTVSAAAASSTARINTITADCCTGNAIQPAWASGFRVFARFGCGDAASVATARQFVGLTYTTFTGDPSAQLCLLGVGCDSGDTNLSLYTNDFSGTATKVPLGAAFPAHTLSADVYDLFLYSPQAGGSVYAEVTRVNTGDKASTTFITDLPQAGTGLSMVFQRGNGATALSTRLDIFSLYTDKEV